MSETMFYVGFCSSCGTGPLGVRICGGCQRPVVLCDECDAVWLEPTAEGEPQLLEQPNLPCPDCGASLLHSDSHWATHSELANAGWLPHVAGEGKAFGGESTEEAGEPDATDPC